MPHADLLFTNAHVFTADPLQPTAEAVAVIGERIAFVGSASEAKAWHGPSTRVIDSQGCTLMPGIIDSHYHLFLGSTELGHIQLWDVQSLEEMKQVIRAYADTHPEQDSISAAQLRYESMPPGYRLTRHDLDDILPDRPLTIIAYDHHNAFANTRALEVAGALHGAPTGPNSAIVMGNDGLATGELVEPAAYCVVLRHFDAWARTVKGLMGETAGKPRYNPERERYWLREGLRLTASYGITSVHNMDGDSEQAAFYAALERDGELSVRVNIPYSIFPVTELSQLSEAVDMAQTYTGSRLRSGRVKLFMDGVMESWTALLLDDYADRPGWKGDALYSAEHFNRIAVECDRLGLQITVHAIGDAAVRRTIEGCELARTTNGPRDSRHRIEHIELIHADDLARLARLGIVASMQPYHSPITFPETHEVFPERVGQSRWDRSFPWQNVRGAGVPVAFGSDWPVVTPNPYIGMQAALTRRPWGPGHLNHRQTLTDTLLSYTRDGAYIEFQEGVKGQLRVGMLADLALLSADLFTTSEDEIARVHAVMTVCGGSITHNLT